MFPLRCGPAPRPRRLGITPALVVCVAAIAGGCAKEGAYSTSSPQWYADPPQRVTAATPPPVEVEDDGQEAQVPPLRHRPQEPDDPREPYSRNYGSLPPHKAEGPAPAMRSAIPDDLPPAFRRQLVSQLDD